MVGLWLVRGSGLAEKRSVARRLGASAALARGMACGQRVDQPNGFDRHNDSVVPRGAGRAETADDGIFEPVVHMGLAVRRCGAGVTMCRLEDVAQLGRNTRADPRLVNPFERPALGHGPASAQSE